MLPEGQISVTVFTLASFRPCLLKNSGDLKTDHYVPYFFFTLSDAAQSEQATSESTYDSHSPLLLTKPTVLLG